MFTEHEPIPLKEVCCDRCGTIIKGILLQDLDWCNAELHFNQPHISCPICGNDIYDVLKKPKEDL